MGLQFHGDTWCLRVPEMGIWKGERSGAGERSSKTRIQSIGGDGWSAALETNCSAWLKASLTQI